MVLKSCTAMSFEYENGECLFCRLVGIEELVREGGDVVAALYSFKYASISA